MDSAVKGTPLVLCDLRVLGAVGGSNRKTV